MQQVNMMWNLLENEDTTQAYLVASLSTSCNNAVILSSCYKVVTHNLLTNC
jgi:inner membrane protein involved in colicin E2 resistance